MADGVGRMLNAVLLHAEKRYPSKPIDAPWMASVLAAGAPAKLVDLMAPFASELEKAKANKKFADDVAMRALAFFSQWAGGTGAVQPTSRPHKAAPRASRASGGGDDGISFDGRVRVQGTCAECGANVQWLKWCSGCHLVGYCDGDCQRAAWKKHKKLCLPHFKWESFVKHVMAVQTEPFLAGPWAGRMPAEVYAESRRECGRDVPVYSKRQLSLQEYIMMLSAAEKGFSSAPERLEATDGADGVSEHGAVTWVRAGVVAATYAHGPKLRLCDRASCEKCLIVWRQTLDARICQVCDKPLASFRGLGVPIVGPTTPVWMRSVHPDPQDGEPRLHFAELETCSDACKRTVLASFAQNAQLSRNDFIDSVDALTTEGGASSGAVSVDFDQLSLG